MGMPALHEKLRKDVRACVVYSGTLVMHAQEKRIQR